MNRTVQINIPITQIQERRFDKIALEELACAVMIKQRYANSVLLNVNTKRIMEFFHVSYGKAVSLLTRFKYSHAFYWNEKKKALYAKSLKSREVVYYGKEKKYKSSTDFCCKTSLSVKLCEAVKELRAILALNVINASMRKSKVCLDKQISQSNYCRVAAMDAILKERKMCKAVGVSCATLCRLLQWLEKAGRIGKVIIARCVTTDLENYNTEKKGLYIWHADHSGWVMSGSIYYTPESERQSFRHVIWNYRREKNDKKSKGKDYSRYCD